MTTTTNQPIEKIKLGPVTATIWKNETQNGNRYSVSLDRVYRKTEGGFANTTSFGRDELLLAAKVADLPHTFICQQIAADRAKATEEDAA